MAWLAYSPSSSSSSRLELLHDEPAAFFSEILGIDPWGRQLDILNAVRDHSFVACRSGQKTGKSCSAAGLALWWATTRVDGRVVLTAPAHHQVQNILFPEFRSLYHRAAKRGYPLGGHLYDDPHKGLVFGDKWGVFAVTTDTPERMQGVSGGRLFYVVDEASGYPESLFEAVFGNLAGGGRVLLIGNPTQTSGTFYNAFRSGRGHWNTLHISSLESPNFHGGHVSGLATPGWESWAAEEWGRDSPIYDVRVRGQFPSQAENAVISVALMEAAIARWPDTSDAGALELGVDPAGFGDDEAVIYPRRGRKALEPFVLRSMDPDQIAGEVLAVVKQLRRDTDPGKIRVKVDAIGVGLGVCGCLREAKGIDLVRVSASSGATANGYAKLRDQLWFAARDWLKEGGALPPSDGRCHAELVAPTYEFDAQGRYKVEPKDETKSRLKRSPDRADALCLAVYSPGPSGKAPPPILLNQDAQSIHAE